MKPRPYQKRCSDAVFDYFGHSNGNPLVIVPTGGGKSLIIGLLCHTILHNWPGQRILILSHVKELIEQNYEKIKALWSRAPAGIYSASLGKRQAHHPITFATIQSVHNKAHVLGHRDLVFIDECHLVSNKDTGMYLKLLTELARINPRLKVVGFSATAYRLDMGMLHEGQSGLFTDVAIEIPIMELLEEGYLTRLISKASLIQANLQSVGLIGGEFNSKQLAAAFDQDGFTAAVLDEVLTLAAGRKSMLFFCADVEHAHHVRDGLRARGIAAEAVTGKTPHGERDELLTGFREGRVPALCSVGIVTTGFDAPNADCLVILRATMSPGLYVQIIGRGLRPVYAPGFNLDTREGRLAAMATGPKPNCLVLDYGSNIERHGPVTHVNPPRRGKKKGERLEAPTVRICELCRTAHPLGTIECGECGNIMVRERDPLAKLEQKASDAEIMMSDEEYLEKSTVWADVDAVFYRRHRKEGKPDSLRVEYQCGMMVYKEWVCLFHDGFAGKKGVAWWTKRGGQPAAGIEEALRLAEMIEKPTRIRVRKNDKHFEVLDYEFGPPRQAELAIGA